MLDELAARPLSATHRRISGRMQRELRGGAMVVDGRGAPCTKSTEIVKAEPSI